MLKRLCRAVFWLYVIMAILSLLLVPISAWHLLGIEPSPLAGVCAVLLAQPWLSLLPTAAASKSILWSLVLIGSCLALNAAILRLICRLLQR